MYVFISVLCHGQDNTDSSSKPSCKDAPCPENAVCNDRYGYISCECITGKTGFNCTIDDPCTINTTNCPADSVCYGTCNPNIACEGATGVAFCHGCVAGWTGTQCLEDVDECADDIPACLNDGICKNSMGDFDCICQSGWTGKQCDCLKGSECDVEDVTTDIPDVSPDSPDVKQDNGSSQLNNLYNTLIIFTIFYVCLSQNT
ncbi:hypothetical protein ACF0H5_004257 [Mactra antiquata]